MLSEIITASSNYNTPFAHQLHRPPLTPSPPISLTSSSNLAAHPDKATLWTMDAAVLLAASGIDEGRSADSA